MKKENFYKTIEDLLELDITFKTNGETTIEDILEYDSLAHITLISYILDEFGVELKAEIFTEIETLDDLIIIIGNDKFDK